MTKTCNLTLSRWHNVAERLSRGYPQDAKSCNTTAGCRSSYDVRNGMFRLMPWERNTGA